MLDRLLPLALLGLCLCTGCARRAASELPRRGDEIMVCGRLFHTGAPVVLFTDPGGYDAYRTEKRYVPWERAPWQAPPAGEKPDGPSSPNRYAIRFAPGSDTGPLSKSDFERIRGGGWDLPTLQNCVDQFVLHYDACGVSRQCFRTLHDSRGLSVHFMLDLDGTIYQTLDLKDKAWHATTSNDRSVGIEIANIGAYSDDEPAPFDRWYRLCPCGCAHAFQITIPPDLGDGGVRTPGFVGHPARDRPIEGQIQGRRLRQYDLTPEQYRSLVRLTATLCTIFPKLPCDYPRDAQGDLQTQRLDDQALQNFRGILGHYHIQTNKIDPGPAIQWDWLIKEARRRIGTPPRADRAAPTDRTP